MPSAPFGLTCKRPPPWRSRVGLPDETSRPLESHTFRLCHIDVDVYDSARDVFDWAWSRVVAGGVIVFDDFGFHNCEGVTRFVTETGHQDDALLVHNLNGHAILVRTNESARGAAV